MEKDELKDLLKVDVPESNGDFNKTFEKCEQGSVNIGLKRKRFLLIAIVVLVLSLGIVTSTVLIHKANMDKNNPGNDISDGDQQNNQQHINEENNNQGNENNQPGEIVIEKIVEGRKNPYFASAGLDVATYNEVKKYNPNWEPIFDRMFAWGPAKEGDTFSLDEILKSNLLRETEKSTLRTYELDIKKIYPDHEVRFQVALGIKNDEDRVCLIDYIGTSDEGSDITSTFFFYSNLPYKYKTIINELSNQTGVELTDKFLCSSVYNDNNELISGIVLKLEEKDGHCYEHYEAMIEGLTEDKTKIDKDNLYNFQPEELGEEITVEGIVIAVMGFSFGDLYNCMYVLDSETGITYYAFNMAQDPTDGWLHSETLANQLICQGMTVRLTGKKKMYNGTLELVDGSYELLDKEIKKIPVIDYTDKILDASSLKDESILSEINSYVTIKNVVIGEVGGKDGTYYYCTVGDGDNKKDIYVRIHPNLCPLTNEDTEDFIYEYKIHYKWTADVSGLVSMYNDEFYLTPITYDAFTYLSVKELSDHEMIELEYNNISFVKTVSKDCYVDVLQRGRTYSQVYIRWDTDERVDPEALGRDRITSYYRRTIAVHNGERSIYSVKFALPNEDTDVVVKAVLMCGEETMEKDFNVHVYGKNVLLSQEEVLERAFDLPEGASFASKQILGGTIIEIKTPYSDYYGNITVIIKPDVTNDDDHNIQCFRLSGGSELKVGDHIFVTGILQNYYGQIEFSKGATYVIDDTDSSSRQIFILKNLLTIGDKMKFTVFGGTIVNCMKIEEENRYYIEVIPDYLSDKITSINGYINSKDVVLTEGQHIVIAGELMKQNNNEFFVTYATYYSTTETFDEVYAKVESGEIPRQ